jgi:predicted transcriptional regulator
MQVMHRKGLLKRSERFRSHVYEASQPRGQVQRSLAQSLLKQAFGGSAASLVQSALGGRKVSAAELAEIREVLEKFGGKS